MNATRYFRLGLFILTSLSVLIAGAVALGAGSMFAKSVEVETCFDESIAGLDVGAPVKHRGVTIGHVQSIQFARNSVVNDSPSAEPFKYILVEMAIDPHVVADVSERRLKPVLDKMVSAGLRARVAQSGITGSAYVDLDYLDPHRYPIHKPPVETDALYVPSAPGAFNQVVDALTDIATKLQQANLDQVVKHADTLLIHMDQSVQELQLAQLRNKAGAILDQVQSASTRLQQILNDPKVGQAIADLPEITGRVRSIATRADELLKNGKLDESATHLRQTLAEADSLLAGQSDNVRAILDDLRATVANARELTEEVKTNPSQLLVGQPPARTHYGSSK
jgi:phospholipid/cholesterol/gamma-HCH transport system substrate-binding protein/paraquat-inducible protein B